LTFESRSGGDDSSEHVYVLNLCCPHVAVYEKAASIACEVQFARVIERRKALNVIQEAGINSGHGCGVKTSKPWLQAQEVLDVEGFREGV
jgi:hypothetical protein